MPQVLRRDGAQARIAGVDVKAARGLLAMLSLLACATTSASVLYKSIGPNGVVQFSDRPPENARLVAAIPMDAPPQVPALVAATPDPDAPRSAVDAAVDKANAKVDLAEHALAQARLSVWSEPDVTKLGPQRMSRADRDRIAWYEREVRQARLSLADAMRRKIKADLAVTLTASNDWQPYVRPTDRR